MCPLGGAVACLGSDDPCITKWTSHYLGQWFSNRVPGTAGFQWVHQGHHRRRMFQEEKVRPGHLGNPLAFLQALIKHPLSPGVKLGLL